MFQSVLLFSIFSFFSVISGLNVSSFTVKSCGLPTDIGSSLVFDVSPKLPDTDYILFLNADLSKEVTSGTSKYDITYNFIPLTPSTNDLCTEISHSNITCPLVAGHLSSESKGTMPTGLSGTYTIKNQWFNSDGARILCMLFTIKT